MLDCLCLRQLMKRKGGLFFRKRMSFIAPFYESVKKIIFNEQLIKKDDKVVVAVSGGADSLSLLILLNRLRLEPGFSFNIHVAHLNHGLRGESAARDAEFVRLTAKQLGLPCTVGRVKAGDYKKRWGLSPEDAARHLRYRFLQQLALKIKADSVAVGHNMDDQAETILLNFLRGTGPDGLTGMKLRRDMGKSGVLLIRPLLNFSRREIEKFCRESGFIPRFDETNLDPHYLRNRIRKDVLPFLEKAINPKLKDGLLRLSRLLTLDKDFWDHFVEERFKAVILEERPGCLVLGRGLFVREHEALQGRMLRFAVSRLLGSVPRGVDYHRIRAVLDLVNKDKPRGAVFFPGGIVLSRDYEKVILQTDFSGENCHLEQFFPVLLPVPGEVSIGAKGTVLRARLSRPGDLAWPPDEKKEAYLDFDRVLELSSRKGFPAAGEKDAALLVRTRMPGDRFYPLGAPGKKKLKDYFIDRKISWKERDRILLVVAGDEIIWVAGRHISQLCRITGDTKEVVILSLESGLGLEMKTQSTVKGEEE